MANSVDIQSVRIALATASRVEWGAQELHEHFCDVADNGVPLDIAAVARVIAESRARLGAIEIMVAMA